MIVTMHFSEHLLRHITLIDWSNRGRGRGRDKGDMVGGRWTLFSALVAGSVVLYILQYYEFFGTHTTEDNRTPFQGRLKEEGIVPLTLSVASPLLPSIQPAASPSPSSPAVGPTSPSSKPTPGLSIASPSPQPSSRKESNSPTPSPPSTSPTPYPQPTPTPSMIRNTSCMFPNQNNDTSQLCPHIFQDLNLRNGTQVCLPYMVGIGTMKGGSSSVYANLRKHRTCAKQEYSRRRCRGSGRYPTPGRSHFWSTCHISSVSPHQSNIWSHSSFHPSTSSIPSWPSG